MSLKVRRPVQLSFRVRRNFATRDWTSIGLRGARVSLREVGRVVKRGSAGSGQSPAHSDESRIIGFRKTAAKPDLDSSALPARDRRGFFWITFVALSIAAAALRLIT
jgi:hypothetical protein